MISSLLLQQLHMRAELWSWSLTHSFVESELSKIFYITQTYRKKKTILFNSSLLYKFCLSLVCLTWIVFVMGGRWRYSSCFVGCCLQDLFIITHIILVKLPSSFFSISFVSVNVVHRYSSIDMTTAWKKLCFILSVRSDFHTTDRLPLAVPDLASRMLMSVSVNETLLPR